MEQFYPRKMSWYSAEAPQGVVAATSLMVREHPFAAVGIALATGMLMGLLLVPLTRREGEKREQG